MNTSDTTLPTTSPTPAIAIVIATYNMADTLRHAIESARRQTFTDWELLVVGDGCTDHTAEVVKAFGDDRIRFFNLSVNCGDQSGPNNFGVAHTRAPLIAFLNHDDVWFDDHLELAYEALHARHADIAFAASVTYQLRDNQFHRSLEGITSGGRYDPNAPDGFISASTWLVRRDALEDFRGWRSEHECTLTPSQDLLFRAHRRGLRIFGTGALSVATIPAGLHDNSYNDDQFASAAARVAAELAQPAIRARLLTDDARTTRAGEQRRASSRTRRDRTWWTLSRIGALIGAHPRAIELRLRQGVRRGALINNIRANRGLHPLPRRTPAPNSDATRSWSNATTPRAPRCGSIGAATRIDTCASGWSPPDDDGTWNDGPDAELVFRLPHFVATLTMGISVVANADGVHPQRFVIRQRGAVVAEASLDHANVAHLVFDVHPDHSRMVALQCHFPDTRQASNDRRELAVKVIMVNSAPLADGIH